MFQNGKTEGTLIMMAIFGIIWSAKLISASSSNSATLQHDQLDKVNRKNTQFNRMKSMNTQLTLWLTGLNEERIKHLGEFQHPLCIQLDINITIQLNI